MRWNRASSGSPAARVSHSAARRTGTWAAVESGWSSEAEAKRAVSMGAAIRSHSVALRLRIAHQAVPFDLSMQIPAVHAEPLRGLGHVPGALAQSGEDRVPLGAIARGADLAHGLLLGSRGQRRLDLPDPDRFAFAHDEEPLDQVLQLAHVARPGVPRERLDGLRADPPHRTAVLLPETGHEVLDQERDVL